MTWTNTNPFKHHEYTCVLVNILGALATSVKKLHQNLPAKVYEFWLVSVSLRTYWLCLQQAMQPVHSGRQSGGKRKLCPACQNVFCLAWDMLQSKEILHQVKYCHLKPWGLWKNTCGQIQKNSDSPGIYLTCYNCFIDLNTVCEVKVCGTSVNLQIAKEQLIAAH